MLSYRKVLAMIAVLSVAPMATLVVAQETKPSVPATPRAQSRWDRQAEQSFRMGRGQGRQLMTQAEWQEHQQKMRSLSPEERERYRKEMHQKMVERAKEKGITLPEDPGSRGGPSGGPGSGMVNGRGAGRRGQ